MSGVGKNKNKSRFSFSTTPLAATLKTNSMGEENRDGFVGSKTIHFLEGFDTRNTEFSDSLNLGLSLGCFYAQIPEKTPLIVAENDVGDVGLSVCVFLP